VRFINIPLGAWIIASPFLLEEGTASSTVLDVVIGLALMGLSLPRGTRSDEHYGGWDRAIV
jgi:SPW repeat